MPGRVGLEAGAYCRREGGGTRSASGWVDPAFELFVPRFVVVGVERLLAGGLEENRTYAPHVGSRPRASPRACSGDM